MPSKPSVCVVGPGRLGRALAENLIRAGYTVNEVIFPNAQSLRKGRSKLSRELQTHATTVDLANFGADLIWLCVPDTQINSVAKKLKSVTQWKGKAAFHSSGALSSDELQPLRSAGAVVASVHPLMTFVDGEQPDLANVPFALEGDPAAVRRGRQIIKKFGGDAFVVKKQNKALYHAWGTLLSPLLLSYMVAAEQVAKFAGISAQDARKRMLPIAKQTLSNYVTVGSAGAFSGPLVRGDVEVVREHLKALKGVPEARAIYLASANSALRHLPVRNRKQLEKSLRTD